VSNKKPLIIEGDVDVRSGLHIVLEANRYDTRGARDAAADEELPAITAQLLAQPDTSKAPPPASPLAEVVAA
jgi:hypothetical protein